MQRIQFGIGIGEDNNGVAIDDQQRKCMIDTAMLLLSNIGLPGGFLTEGEGYWRNDDSQIVRERGITITIDVGEPAPHMVRGLARHLAEIFDQESVHVAQFPVYHYNT